MRVRVRVCMTKVREDMCKRERGGIGIVCKKDRVKERKRKRMREREERERREREEREKGEEERRPNPS